MPTSRPRPRRRPVHLGRVILAALAAAVLVTSIAGAREPLWSDGSAAAPSAAAAPAAAAATSAANGPPEDGSSAEPPVPHAPDAATATPCPGPPVSLAPVPVVRHGPRTDKVVALTFDDGWDVRRTARILAILRARHVPATFFPIGRAILREPATWRAIVAAGFPIGNHTFDHHDLTGRCYPTQLRELTRQADTVATVLGAMPLAVMRPPYGDYDATTRLAARQAGESAIVLWDVDTRDWTGLSARAITARALAGRPGSIILMHTFGPNTPAALPAIISGYRARGYRFVTIPELLGIVSPN